MITHRVIVEIQFPNKNREKDACSFVERALKHVETSQTRIKSVKQYSRVVAADRRLSMKIEDMARVIEANGYDWLVRSNRAPAEGSPAPYFANITYGSSVGSDGRRNPKWEGYPSFGSTAEEALETSYNLWKKVQKI